MINWTLFKQEIKNNYRLFLIFIFILVLYTSIIITMYDPQFAASLEQMSQSMPELFAAFGMANISTNLTEFLINYLYGFLYLIFPIVFIVLVINNLIVKYIDKGSMAYLLATPNKREKIILTQGFVSLFFSFLMLIFITLFCIIVGQIFFPGELNIGGLILVNLGLFGLWSFVASVCFITSCIFSDSKKSIGVSMGIIIYSVLVQMLSQFNDKLSFLKYLTPLSLFNSLKILSGDSKYILLFIILYFASAIFYFIGIKVFKSKDLSL